MPYVRVGESDFYYESHGEGPTIVLGHGVAGNHASWFNQVPAFSQRYRTVIFEHRGFGNTHDAEGLGRSAFVDDFEAFMDALEIDQAALIGQSLCGGTFAGYACRRPERVSALVIAASMVAMTAPDALKPAIAANEARTRGWLQPERVLGPRIRAERPEQALLYMQIASFNAITIKTLKGEPVQWAPEDIAATGLPLLYVVGEDDPLCLPGIIREVAALIPNAEVAEIQGAGHSTYFEEPGAFNAAVLAFLDRELLAVPV